MKLEGSRLCGVELESIRDDHGDLVVVAFVVIIVDDWRAWLEELDAIDDQLVASKQRGDRVCEWQRRLKQDALANIVDDASGAFLETLARQDRSRSRCERIVDDKKRRPVGRRFRGAVGFKDHAVCRTPTRGKSRPEYRLDSRRRHLCLPH